LLWCEKRAAANGSHTIAILGGSRALVGIDPHLLDQSLPGWHAFQLALDGTSPFAVMRDLVEDQKFKGVILCDVGSLGVMETSSRTMAKDWVSFYHDEFPKWGMLDRRANTEIRTLLQSRFVVLSSPLGLPSLVRIGPYKSYEHMLPSRFRPAEFRARMSPEKLRLHRAWRIERAMEILRDHPSVPDPDVVQGWYAELKTMRETIEQRGGRLIFVRMPTSGEHWTLDEKFYPRDIWWNGIESNTGIPCMHFADYDSLKNIDCPDSSHLDATDVPAMTDEIARFLIQRGIVVPQ
jgi:hypothetical protein